MNSINFKKLSIWKSEYAISIDGVNSGACSFSDIMRNKLLIDINNQTWQIKRKGFWNAQLVVEHNNLIIEVPVDWRFRCSIELGREKYDFHFEGFFKQDLVWTNGSGIRVIVCERPSSFKIECDFKILDNRINNEDAKMLSIISFYLYLSKLKAATAAIA